ncbi:MAG: helix-turn-helix domain-containing protein [Lachnospiraceae bacterium]
MKMLRTDAGFTQEELAARLHLEGKSAISNYENNSRGGFSRDAYPAEPPVSCIC